MVQKQYIEMVLLNHTEYLLEISVYKYSLLYVRLRHQNTIERFFQEIPVNKVLQYPEFVIKLFWYKF